MKRNAVLELLNVIALALAANPTDLKANIEVERRAAQFRDDNDLDGSDETSVLAGAVIRAATQAAPTADATFAAEKVAKDEEQPAQEAATSEEAVPTTAKRGPGRPKRTSSEDQSQTPADTADAQEGQQNGEGVTQ